MNKPTDNVSKPIGNQPTTSAGNPIADNPNSLSAGPHGPFTLLVDAIHAMTPTLGRGASIAMRDGVLLARHLGDVVQGRQKLAQAISEYETEMTTYAFDVVKKSAAMGARLVGQNPLPSGS
jgi:2-polyprenyl-6-methoxyphenol hydroxylase-like FAD-dependent oxidoreductase